MTENQEPQNEQVSSDKPKLVPQQATPEPTQEPKPKHESKPDPKPKPKSEPTSSAHNPNKSDDEISIDLSVIKKYLKDDRVILGLLFLLSLVIHLIYQNAGLYHFDSAFDTLVVERTVNEWSLNYSYGWGAPGMVVLVSIVYFFQNFITGATSAEFAYNFVNIFSASIAIPFVFILTKYLTKDRFIAIVSALFFCVMPIWLSITTYPKTHAMTIAIGITAVYLFLRSRDAKSTRNQALLLVTSGALTGLAISIRPFSVFYMLPMAIIYLASGVSMKNKKIILDKRIINIKNVLLFFIPIFVVWYLLFFVRLDIAGGFGAFKAQLANEQRDGWQGMFNAQTKLSFSYLTTTIGLVGWIVALLGLVYSFLKREKVLAIALFVWGASFFFYLGNLLPTEARFLTDALVPLAILMAMGVRLVYANQKYVGIALAIFLIVTMFATIQPLIKDRADYSGPRGFAEYVKANTEPNAIIVSSDEYMFIRRYGERETLYWIEGGIDTVGESLRNGTPVYAIESSFAFTTPADKQRIQTMYTLQVIGEAPNEVYQFSELEHRIFNEKLIKITLKDEQPSIEEKTADEMTDEVVDVVTEVTSEVGTKGAAEDQVEESSEEYAETSEERADEDEQ